MNGKKIVASMLLGGFMLTAAAFAKTGTTTTSTHTTKVKHGKPVVSPVKHKTVKVQKTK